MRLIQEGPDDARIIIVGEAPGATEDATGKPFQGGAGEILNHLLSRAGIPRSECFITNVCHTRPPDNDFTWFFKKANELDLARGIVQLRKDITRIRPNILIGLGGQSLRIIAGKNGIEKWRGSILESNLVPGQKCIFTYHPAYLLRSYDHKTVVELDLRRARTQSTFPEINRLPREFILNPPPDLRQQVGEEMFNAEWLSVDIECFQRDDGTWSLACCGFSDRPDRAMVIPVLGASDKDFIRWLCGGPSKKVFQNGTFDVTVLRTEGIEVANFQWDTMLGHHALYAECAGGSDELSNKKTHAAIGKGLAFQTSIYTEEPFYKDDGKLWKESGDINMFWRYNALDCMVTREIRDIQERELVSYSTLHVLKHEMGLVAPLMAATATGIRVDVDARGRLLLAVEREIADLQRQLDSAAGGSINVKSPKQVAALLYNKLGLPAKHKRGSGAETTDAAALTKLAEKHPHPVLSIILGIRERRDIVERYLSTPLDADGRMRCSFDITGTRTGRLSSRASIFGSGTNLQNQPEVIRRVFIADPGKVFVSSDFSQAEARVVAYYAGEEQLISLFSDPDRDVHKENASRIFNIPIGSITYDQRYLAKRIIHASNYGMQADKFVQVVNGDAADSYGHKGTGITITLSEATRLLELYHLLYPGIRQRFWKDVERDLRATRTLDTPFGRKRTFFGRWSDKLLMEAYAYKPQSCVGDLCCKAMAMVHRRLPAGAALLLNVHDSILVQCDPGDVEAVTGIMQECMTIPITIGDRTFTIPTDTVVGSNWGKRTEDNPQGLHTYGK